MVFPHIDMPEDLPIAPPFTDPFKKLPASRTAPSNSFNWELVWTSWHAECISSNWLLICTALQHSCPLTAPNQPEPFLSVDKRLQNEDISTSRPSDPHRCIDCQKGMRFYCCRPNSVHCDDMHSIAEGLQHKSNQHGKSKGMAFTQWVAENLP